MPTRLPVVLMAVLLLTGALFADEIYLTSGKCLRGTITAERPDAIDIRLESGEVQTIPRDEVALVKKGKSVHEEFKERLAAVAEEDADALRDLAAWCGEKRLRRQRTQILRRIVKIDPGCPGTRRALGETWDGSRWTKDRMKGDPGAYEPGATVSAPELRLEIRAPKGWAARVVDGRIEMDGPQRYGCPVRIEILGSTTAAGSGFPTDEGWSEAQAAAMGKYKGTWSERTTGEGEARRCRVRETALGSAGAAFVIRQTAHPSEHADWLPHVAAMLAGAKVLAVKLDYENAAIGVGFCFDKKRWSVTTIESSADGVGGALPQGAQPLSAIMLQHQAEDGQNAMIRYLQIDFSMFEREGVSLDPEDMLDGMLEAFGTSGDIVSSGQTRLGGAKARIVEVDGLEGGAPVRSITVAAARGGKLHMIALVCGDRVIDRYRPDFTRIRTTFKFIGK